MPAVRALPHRDVPPRAGVGEGLRRRRPRPEQHAPVAIRVGRQRIRENYTAL